MPRSYLGRRFDRILRRIVSGGGARPRREGSGRFPRRSIAQTARTACHHQCERCDQLEPRHRRLQLHDRADKFELERLGNRHILVCVSPGQDYLATNPISVTPPAGWSDTITHSDSGTGDGYFHSIRCR